MMAFITHTASVFPDHYYPQEQLTASLGEIWSKNGGQSAVIERFHRNMTVKGRYLALPLEAYEKPTGFGERNKAWIDSALELGESAVTKLLESSGLEAGEIDLFAFTTVTGIAVPSVDARLMNRIPFSRKMKRMPLFGLGCLGGAAGIARAADYLRGHPKEAALVLSIELCSLTFQNDDMTIANVVSSGLFGDGAAAVLMVGREHKLAKAGLPEVQDSLSWFFPDTEQIMGWNVRDSGLQVVLSSDVASVAEQNLRPAVETFLQDHGLSIDDIDHWIAHPGGPKVMDAIESGLQLPEDSLQISRECLQAVGNISSASVLLILQETLDHRKPQPGSYGLLMAMGPAFCAEFVLLKW
jgi:alkylresorcinol/alkylpyrone synthase